MYSNFLYDDKEAFNHLFVDVSEESEPKAIPTIKEHKKEPSSPVRKLKSLFGNFSGSSFVPLLLLFYLLTDCDEDERLIIIALYFLMGI